MTCRRSLPFPMPEAMALGELWMAQKRLQCWPLWVVVDIVYVGQYLHQQLYFTAGFFAVLTLIAVRGWLEWRRDPALVQP